MRKRTHRLADEVCTLYLPQAAAYLLRFWSTGFKTTDAVECAARFVGDDATAAALAFRELTGLRVAIRSYRGPAGMPSEVARIALTEEVCA